jgi:RimJ/RimL family protein N-acetyltransferase
LREGLQARRTIRDRRTNIAGAPTLPMVTLTTERLHLRPFQRSDAADFTRLAGDWAVASMTSDIPHPLTRAQAIAWLKPGRGEVRFAIVLEGRLIGGAGFYRRRSGAAELGFWLGRPWWGRGYATEATRAVMRYGFEARRLPGFTSSHFIDNRASAGVLRKLGFEPVGRGMIMSVARGQDVEAVTYWLDAKHALHTLPLTVKSGARPRWRAWLGRLGGGPA